MSVEQSKVWWKKVSERSRSLARTEPGRKPACSEVRAHLLARGVEPEWIDALTARLEERIEGLDADARFQVLDGVAIAWSTLTGARRTKDDEARELREMERLLGAFSGELQKLDEVLEVLSAYARRMRTASSASCDRILH